MRRLSVSKLIVEGSSCNSRNFVLWLFLDVLNLVGGKGRGLEVHTSYGRGNNAK